MEWWNYEGVECWSGEVFKWWNGGVMELLYPHEWCAAVLVLGGSAGAAAGVQHLVYGRTLRHCWQQLQRTLLQQLQMCWAPVLQLQRDRALQLQLRSNRESPPVCRTVQGH